MPMKYMTVLEASKKWGISDRRVRFLCSQGRIRGIIQQGRRYLIPDNAEKPEDERARKKAVHPRKYNDFTRLDFLKGMVSELPRPGEQASKEAQKRFLIRFACSCAAMEGNSLTKQETEAVFNDTVVNGHPLSEHLSVIGIRDAMLYGFECVEERRPLSQNVIRNIHLFSSLNRPFGKGKYRRVRVRISNIESSPVFLDLQEPRVNDLLNVNTQRKKEMHPIERISRFYLEFHGIHPFEEGNGRTACILLNMELMQNGYPPIELTPEDEPERQKAIHEYETCHSPETMIRLVSKKAEEEMERILSQQRRKKSRKSAESIPKAELNKSEPAGRAQVRRMPLEQNDSTVLRHSNQSVFKK